MCVRADVPTRTRTTYISDAYNTHTWVGVIGLRLWLSGCVSVYVCEAVQLCACVLTLPHART